MSENGVLPNSTATVKNPILVRERRRALINAAVEVFFAKGYHGCRVADVAELAGISQGTVYNYVNSKEDLLRMIVEDHLFEYERIVATALKGAGTAREELTGCPRVPSRRSSAIASTMS